MKTSIDIQVLNERDHPYVVSYQTYALPHDDPISIARKVYLNPGNFQYEWAIEMMSVDEAQELVEALSFAIAHIKESV